MSHAAAQPVIYMLDCHSAALSSMRPLLEAGNRPVREINDADRFWKDICSRRTVRTCDSLIFDLETGEPSSFRLLNLIMREEFRPRILLMAGANAIVGSEDSFPNDRLHVLQHPATPRQLFDLLDAVE